MVSQAAGQTVTGTETLFDGGSSAPVSPVAGDAALVAGRYRLLRPLGTGGMGNVYLAEDPLLARQVAIKTIRPELSSNQEVRSRIRRESRMHAAIGTHPHIITLYDTIEEQGHIYLVLEYFAAETLSCLLAKQHALSLNAALAIIRQLLEALACIHQRDIVHRDIKTSNILVQLPGNGGPAVKLTDFGIARAGLDGSTLTQLTCLDTRGPGTPAYMAPERIDPQTHGRMSPATDLYAVGIILFELLAGQPPFRGAMTDIFTGHLLHPPGFNELPSTLPADLIEVIAKALAKKPGERFQDAGAFHQALAGIAGEQKPLAAKAWSAEATLLQAGSIDETDADYKATVLVPLETGTALPLPKNKGRWWIALAAAAAFFAIVFAVRLQMRSHEFTSDPQPPALSKAPAAAQAAGDLPPPLPSPPETRENSALQAVEKARSAGADTVTATSKNEPPLPAAQEWRIIDNQSRKLQ